MRSPKKVLVALPTANAAARQKLRGIYRYVTEGHDWDIQLIRNNEELTTSTIRNAEQGGIDGFIMSMPDAADALRQAARTTIPLVAIEIDPHVIRPRRRSIVHLRTDNVGIGRAAAGHFRRLGYFRSFAFVPDLRNRSWSQARGFGFTEALSHRQADVRIFQISKSNADIIQPLAAFLDRLPKPLGVFAAWDYVAAQTLSACRMHGLDVPQQVSIIGVDNDEFVCESTKPALSTILVDREQQGHDAAVALNALMCGRRPQAPICRVARVIERESTAPLTPSGSLVERALDLINDHALGGLVPADVAQHLGVSRRLLDLRFAELGSDTLAAAIRARKLKEVRRLLQTTALSDVRIAAACGFRNANALRNLFRSLHGESLRSWRASNANAP